MVEMIRFFPGKPYEEGDRLNMSAATKKYKESFKHSPKPSYIEKGSISSLLRATEKYRSLVRQRTYTTHQTIREKMCDVYIQPIHLSMVCTLCLLFLYVTISNE